MNKRKYMELSQDLQERLYSEKNVTEELRKENSKLMDENNDLNSQLNQLRGRIAELEKSAAEEVVQTEEVTCGVTEDKPEEPKAEVSEPKLSDSMGAGAKIIGKIVLSSAEYCNALSGAAAPQNAKELLNLILGRTEVAKAEILRISALDISYEEKVAAMEQELTEAEDYFKSVMAQKN